MSEPAVKQIVLASRPKGLPTHENFRLQDVPMPELPRGGLLLRVLYLSLDPYMRGRMDDRKSYAKPASIGAVMPGEGVCEVIASDQAGYAVGDIVLAHTGWRTHAASAGAALRKLNPAVAAITTGVGTVGAAVADGRIRYREDITDGFENAPAAFIGMLEGRNFGKALVRVTPSGS